MIRSAARAWGETPGHIRGPVYIILAGALLSVMLLCTRLVGTRLPAPEVSFFRSLIGWVVYWPFVAAAGLGVLRTRQLLRHFLRGSIGGMGSMAMLYAASRLPLAEVTAYSFTRNLFTVVTAGIFLHEGFRRDRIVVTVIGFAGVLVMLRPDTSGLSVAALAAMGGAAAAAISVVLVKQLMATEAPVAVLFYLGLFSTACAAAPLPWLWVEPTLYELGMLAALGVTGSMAQALLVRGMRVAEASFLAPFDYLQLVSAALMGLVVFGELPGLWIWVGAAIVVAANLTLTFREARRNRRPPR